MAVVTKEAVFAAADRIVDAGERVTQARVRQELGGGSFTTIGPFVAEWEASHTDKQQARETRVPDTVQAALAEVAGRLWKAASDEAALGLEAARREVEDLRAKSAAEVEQAAEVVQIVEGERDAALAQIEVLTVERDAAQSATSDAVAATKREADARAVAETTAARQEARAEAAEKAACKADAMAEEAAQRAATALAERDAARADAAEARKSGAEAVETERQRGAETAARAQAEATALREQVASLVAERDGLAARLVTAEAFIAKAEASVTKAERRADRAEARADAADARAAKIEAAASDAPRR